MAATLCVSILAGTWFAVRTVLDPAAPVAPPPAVMTLGSFQEVSPPRALPALALTDLSGKPVTVADLAGKTVLLNLWATWCVPCVKEMPALDRLQKAMGGPAFQVVALSLDRGGAEQVRPFLDKLGLAGLPVLLDTGSASMSALSVRGLPTTLILDPQGRETARFEGAAEWDAPAMVAELKRRMGVPGKPA